MLRRLSGAQPANIGIVNKVVAVLDLVASARIAHGPAGACFPPHFAKRSADTCVPRAPWVL